MANRLEACDFSLADLVGILYGHATGYYERSQANLGAKTGAKTGARIGAAGKQDRSSEGARSEQRLLRGSKIENIRLPILGLKV